MSDISRVDLIMKELDNRSLLDGIDENTLKEIKLNIKSIIIN